MDSERSQLVSNKIDYVKPMVLDLGSVTVAYGSASCTDGTEATGVCNNGNGAGGCASNGFSPDSTSY